MAAQVYNFFENAPTMRDDSKAQNSAQGAAPLPAVAGEMALGEGTHLFAVSALDRVPHSHLSPNR